MDITEILKSNNHRPWKFPEEPWKFYQEWNNAVFLHWEVSLAELKKIVPKELEIDLFNGKAWVSVVLFKMQNIRPKNLPPFAPVSNFEEINIRTYVKSNNKTGVYFLSIEASKYLSCKIAKSISELPYRYSKIKRKDNSCKSYNSGFKDKLHLEYAIGSVNNSKTELDKWLTERYALFQNSKNIINEFEIHHLEWTLNELELIKLNLDYTRFNHLIQGMPQAMHYSKELKVLAWGKQKVTSPNNFLANITKKNP